jgi:glycosyltransferase involved in cell wall biosynthesis
VSTVRIGVDATCWANGRGYGRFARELLRAMVALAPEHEFVFFGDAETFRAFSIDVPNARHVVVRLSSSPTQAASANGNRSARDLLRMSRAVWRETPEVFFSPSVYTYFPLPPRLAAVVTVHDAIAERFPQFTLPTYRARAFWWAKVRLALAQARLVLTVSEFSKRELTAVLDVPGDRIRVASEAPADAYQPGSDAEVAQAATRVGLPVGASWFAYVGGFNPHKRIDTIIRGHAALSASHGSQPPHLLLVGTLADDVFHGEQGHLRALVREAGTEHLVHWTGFVPDEELRHLLTGAVALLLPSESEGFGLPAVEAAACGTPVIATTASPLPELLEGGGIFVAPGDEAALLAAMQAVLMDRCARDQMGQVARQRATALTWERGARVALDAVLEAVR